MTHVLKVTCPVSPQPPAPAYGSDLPLTQDLSSAFSPAIR